VTDGPAGSGMAQAGTSAEDPAGSGIAQAGDAADDPATGGAAQAGGAADGSAGSGTARAENGVVDAWRGLLVAHSRLVPAVEADLRAAGQVPLSWYDVLLELNAAPDLRLRMSRVVDELAAAGLAERQPDQADGRSSFAVLTKQGKEALRRAWPVYWGAIHRHLGARLTAQQCRELAVLLGQVIATVEIDAPTITSQ
jgi:hypothetical protein